MLSQDVCHNSQLKANGGFGYTYLQQHFLPTLRTAAVGEGEGTEETLTFSNADGNIRARVSGTLELEGYVFPQPAPGYIASRGDALFNPHGTRLAYSVEAEVKDANGLFLLDLATGSTRTLVNDAKSKGAHTDPSIRAAFAERGKAFPKEQAA